MITEFKMYQLIYFLIPSQAKKALKNILQKCVHLPALEPLLHDAPPNILKHVVAQFSKVCSVFIFSVTLSSYNTAPPLNGEEFVVLNYQPGDSHLLLNYCILRNCGLRNNKQLHFSLHDTWQCTIPATSYRHLPHAVTNLPLQPGPATCSN